MLTEEQHKPSPELLKVAEFFLAIAKDKGVVITNKKLQKLVYYAQAWHLVFQDKPLYKDTIEAWIHGPAVKSLYFMYKQWGFNPIREENIKMPALDDATLKVLEEVWRIYGAKDAEYLEMLTHYEAPWIAARGGLDASESSNNAIDLALMKSYYSGLLSDGQEKKS